MEQQPINLEGRQSYKVVQQFFQGDNRKATEWFLTKNPLLGDQRPLDMLRVGREGKLIKCIHNLIHGELP